MTKFYKFILKYYCAVTDSIDDVYGIVPADNYGDAMDALNHRFNGNITTITITEMEDDAFLELTPFGWENLKRVVATEETNEPLKEDEIVKEDDDLPEDIELFDEANRCDCNKKCNRKDAKSNCKCNREPSSFDSTTNQYPITDEWDDHLPF